METDIQISELLDVLLCIFWCLISLALFFFCYMVMERKDFYISSLLSILISISIIPYKYEIKCDINQDRCIHYETLILNNISQETENYKISDIQDIKYVINHFRKGTSSHIEIIFSSHKQIYYPENIFIRIGFKNTYQKFKNFILPKNDTNIDDKYIDVVKGTFTDIVLISAIFMLMVQGIFITIFNKKYKKIDLHKNRKFNKKH